MGTRQRKTVAMLAIVATICFCLVGSVDMALPDASAAQIDLYTDKEPYNGRGQNARSDAFVPGEDVRIHAFASYYGYGIANVLVAFEIQGPASQIPRAVLYGAALTNETGVATIDFRLPYESESSIGEWIAFGTAGIAGTNLSDSMAFDVGWIVEIESVKTVDENDTEQLKFTWGSNVGIMLALRSIAMTERNATVTLTIYDSLNNLVNSTEVENVAVQPFGIPVFVRVHLQIPLTSFLGEATVHACSYTNPVSQGGIPYSPEVTTNFLIVTHDVAILTVQKSTVLAYEGETVYIKVTVQNKGTETESFGLSAYINESLIYTEHVHALEPLSQVVVQFQWNTTNLPQGPYHISILADIVPGELWTSDNLFDAGLVEIRSRSHDVAITQVAPESSVIQVGETLAIQVSVKNLGQYVESFNVTLCYSTEPIEAILVEDLEPGAERTLIIQWNTSDALEGKYTLNAFASSVQDEIDSTNNIYIDGTIELTNAPAKWLETNLADAFWLLALILVAALLLILLVSRRRRRKAQSDFNDGWAAWYYGYSVRHQARRSQLRLKPQKK